MLSLAENRVTDLSDCLQKAYLYKCFPPVIHNYVQSILDPFFLIGFNQVKCECCLPRVSSTIFNFVFIAVFIPGSEPAAAKRQAEGAIAGTAIQGGKHIY